MKIIIITGGAGGIGLATAVAFSKLKNTKLIIIDRNKKNIKLAQEKIECDTYIVDVTKNISQVIRKIYKKYHKIDILINCAGRLGPVGKFHTNNLEDWVLPLSVNLLGTVKTCHAVLPYMIKNRHGKIVNFSGGGALYPFPNFSAYSTSKAAVVRFTENLASEYKKNNIQVNAIAPGAINTKFLDDSLKAGVKSLGHTLYKKLLKQKRSGGDSVEMAAKLILFLVSTDLTGKIISAKWDNWQKWTRNDIKRINKTTLYTLRRMQ